MFCKCNLNIFYFYHLINDKHLFINVIKSLINNKTNTLHYQMISQKQILLILLNLLLYTYYFIPHYNLYYSFILTNKLIHFN